MYNSQDFSEMSLQNPESIYSKQQINRGNEFQADFVNSSPVSINSSSKINPQPSYRRWNKKEKLLHIKFYLKELKRNPWCLFSWNCRKANDIYKRMHYYIKTKSTSQCKDYDRGIKKENKDKMDLMPYILLKARKNRFEDKKLESLILELTQMSQSQSKYMKIIQENLENIGKVQNDLLTLMEKSGFTPKN